MRGVCVDVGVVWRGVVADGVGGVVADGVMAWCDVMG